MGLAPSGEHPSLRCLDPEGIRSWLLCTMQFCSTSLCCLPGLWQYFQTSWCSGGFPHCETLWYLLIVLAFLPDLMVPCAVMAWGSSWQALDKLRLPASPPASSMHQCHILWEAITYVSSERAEPNSVDNVDATMVSRRTPNRLIPPWQLRSPQQFSVCTHFQRTAQAVPSQENCPDTHLLLRLLLMHCEICKYDQSTKACKVLQNLKVSRWEGWQGWACTILFCCD